MSCIYYCPFYRVRAMLKASFRVVSVEDFSAGVTVIEDRLF